MKRQQTRPNWFCGEKDNLWRSVSPFWLLVWWRIHNDETNNSQKREVVL
jgi:hypothetical protein